MIGHIQFLVFVCLLFFLHGTSAQTIEEFDIAQLVHIDTTITITAQRSLDIQDMIRLCRSDETLYRAFSRLRYYSLDQKTSFHMHDKRRKIANYKSVSHQDVSAMCRTISCEMEEYDRRFYKKNKPRFYTFQVFNRLFPKNGTYCGQQHPDSLTFDPNQKLKGREKHIQELKKLIFSPGSPTNIPLLGNKTEIFSEEMSTYYDYLINLVTEDDQEYYVFSVRVKSEDTVPKNKTIIKYLNTYFERKTLKITKRNYHLKANTIGYQFDVQMNIEMTSLNVNDTHFYIPTQISYDGSWDIPFKAEESGRFTINFSNIIPRP